MQLSPVLAELEQYPFARLDEWRADARRRGIDLIDFGVGDPREVDARVHPRGARRRDRRASPRTRARPGCPSSARRSRRGSTRRFGVDVDADRRDRADARLEGGDLLVRAGRARRAAARRRPRAGVSRLRARRALRRRRGRRRCRCARSARLAARPRRVRRAGTSSRSSGRATRTTRPGRRRRSRSTRSSPAARASTASSLCSDEAYSELWFDEPPVSALQVADRENVVVFNTLSKRSSMTGYRSGLRLRAAGRRGRAAHVPAVDGHGAAGVRPARVGRRVVRRGARRGGARALPAQARDRSSPRSSAKGLRLAGGDATFYLWLAVDGPSEAVRAAPARARHPRRAGLVLRRRRRGLRPARARPDAGRLRAGGRRSSRRSCDDRGDDRRARPRRDPRRRAGGRRLGRQRGGAGGDPRLLPARARWSRARSGRSSTTTRSRSSRATRSSASASCRRRSRATARSSRAASC